MYNYYKIMKKRCLVEKLQYNRCKLMKMRRVVTKTTKTTL